MVQRDASCARRSFTIGVLAKTVKHEIGYRASEEQTQGSSVMCITGRVYGKYSTAAGRRLLCSRYLWLRVGIGDRRETTTGVAMEIKWLGGAWSNSLYSPSSGAALS